MTHGPILLPKQNHWLKGLAPVGLAAVLLVPAFGCSNDSEEAPAAEAAPEAASEEDKAPEQIDAAALREGAKTVLWVPNPSEIQNALRALEVSTDVSSLVTTKAFDFRPMDGPQIALNTGVVTADLVLTVQQSSNEEIAGRVDLIKQGLTELGANQELLDTAGQFADRVRAGRLERDAIISELDAFQSSFLDGVERYSSTDAAVGLQAGAWVEAVHIIATTLATNDAAGTGAHIFRQPYVVEYFLTYIRANAEKAGDGTLLEGVVPAMEELLALTRKEELTAEDVATIRDKTGTILSRF